MTATPAELLACLRLVGGDSDMRVWEFTSASHHAVVTVGSGPKADWQVEGRGVAPLHFTLRWDGVSLHIADTHGTGSVRVDGERVGEQFQLLDRRARIEFGQAAIVTETWSSRPSSAPPGPPATSVRYVNSVDSMQEPARSKETRPMGAVQESTGTRLAHVSKHTIEGYAIKATEDSELTDTLSGNLQARSSEPSQASAGTALVTRGPARGELQPAQRQALDPSSAGRSVVSRDPEDRIPQAVLVLTPNPGANLPENMAGFSTPPPRMASWRAVSLSFVVILGGYAGWVYLMTTL